MEQTKEAIYNTAMLSDIITISDGVNFVCTKSEEDSIYKMFRVVNLSMFLPLEKLPVCL